MIADQSAILLTQEEWDDLAYICERWRQGLGPAEPASEDDARRAALADRVVRAAGS